MEAAVDLVAVVAEAMQMVAATMTSTTTVVAEDQASMTTLDQVPDQILSTVSR